MLKNIKRLLGLSKGIFQKDKKGFIFWSSYKTKVLSESVDLNFEQNTIKQNLINNFERVKRGLNSLFKKYPKIKNINIGVVVE